MDVKEYLNNPNKYALPGVEGQPFILRSEIITHEDLVVGDKVVLFKLPDGRHFISKADPGTEDSFTIGKLTPAHICFEEITLEEKQKHVG